MADIAKSLASSYENSAREIKIPLKVSNKDENTMSTGITEIGQSEAEESESESEDSFGSFEEAEQIDDMQTYSAEKTLEVDEQMRPRQPLSVVISN